MTLFLVIEIVPNSLVVSQMNPVNIPVIAQFSQKLCLQKGVASYWSLHMISYYIEFSLVHYELQSGKNRLAWKVLVLTICEG